MYDNENMIYDTNSSNICTAHFMANKPDNKQNETNSSLQHKAKLYSMHVHLQRRYVDTLQTAILYKQLTTTSTRD